MSIPVVSGAAGGELLPISGLVLKGRDWEQGYSQQPVPYQVGSSLLTWFALEPPSTALVMKCMAGPC